MPEDKIVALIPVREGSGRIKDKNFRPFAGEPSLFELKIKQLKAENCFDEIYVSSNSDRVKKICESHDVAYLERDPIMCTSKPRWDDVIVSILNNVPGNPVVAWTLATSPIFHQYGKAVEAYRSRGKEHDSLVAAHRIQEYMVDAECRPLFYSFGPWHPYTNELPPLYIINDALYIAEKQLQMDLRYWIGRKPFLYEISKLEGIDINFPEDFELAEAAYQMKTVRAQS